MIYDSGLICPICGGNLKYYDKVRRMVRTKKRAPSYLELRRFKCAKCGKVHREITDDIFPHKHYEAEIILGVLEEYITTDTIGFEDYPCETTMIRWRAQKLQLLLWRS
jgi:uncharacterized Zn finger protein